MSFLSLSPQRSSLYRLHLLTKQITARPFHTTLRNYLAHKDGAMATTQHDESHEYFNYTSGRWLWGEEERLRERYRAFNVNELQKVAVGITGSEKCVSMSKIGEGNFNKVFRLQMDNGSVLMARIPHPNAGPPMYTTASEVATMDFAQSILDIPVPKVLAYSATADNPVGSEYIIMEEAQGIDLSKIWYTIDTKDLLNIVTELVNLDEKLLSISLNRHGALYYKKDNIPGCETAQITGNIMDSLAADVADRFVIGPSVEKTFWMKQRAVMDIDRGPWTSACEYVEAIAHCEIAWLNQYSESLPPSKSMWGILESQRDRQAHIDLLGKYLSVVAQLLPKEPHLLAPMLWHRDLHASNVFVHEGKISSVVDWQSCWVGPLILQGREPVLLQYDGDLMLELPPEYEEMPEHERRLVEYKLRQSALNKSYELQTAVRNPLLHRVLRHPSGEMLNYIVRFAFASVDEDIIPLRDCLIKIEKNWKDYDSSTAACPYHFSDEEVQKAYEDADNFNGMQDIWAKLKDIVDSTGFTTHELFDHAVHACSNLREEGLTFFKDNDLKHFEERTRWVLDLKKKQ